MSTLAIPTPANAYPDETVRVPIAGTTYLIRWLWNARGGYWAFSLLDTSGDAIINGVRVAINVDLIGRCIDERKPPGSILVLDPSDAGGADPGLEDLGKRVKVVYWEPAP
jgi:hypothetical protein